MISPEHRPGRPEAGQHIRSSDCSSHFSLFFSLVWKMLNEPTSSYNVLFLLHIIIEIWSTGQIDRNAAIDIVWIFIFNRYMSLSPIPARCQLDSTQLLFVSFILLGSHHYWGVKGRLWSLKRSPQSALRRPSCEGEDVRPASWTRVHRSHSERSDVGTAFSIADAYFFRIMAGALSLSLWVQ